MLEADAVAHLVARLRRRARARRTPRPRAPRCGAARARATWRAPATPASRSAAGTRVVLPAPGAARSTSRRPAVERVDARAGGAGSIGSGRALPRPTAAPLEDRRPWPSSMVTTDPLAADARLLRRAGRGGARRLHAPGVRQHVRGADAGRARAGRSRLRTHVADAVREAVRAWSDGAAADRGLHARPRRPRLRAARRGWRRASAPRSSRRRTCVARFHRYRLMHGLNARINQRQFSLPQPHVPERFDWPTLLVRDRLTQRLGDVERALPRGARRDRRPPLGVGARERAALHRRPDHLAGPELRQPAEGAALPEEWAEALEAMAGARRRVPLPGPRPRGAGPRRRAARCSPRRRATCAYIVEQVRERMNAGTDGGRDLPRRRARSGAGDAALPARHLRPSRSSSCATCCGSGAAGGTATPPTCCRRRWPAQAAEIARLAGGVRRLVARGRALLDGGDARHGRAPGRVGDARRARRSARRRRSSATSTARLDADAEALMARGIYRAAMHDAQRALGEEPTRGATPACRSAGRRRLGTRSGSERSVFST